MWFNILKNERRRAAYRLFINSMIHRGELIPLKDPEVILDEGGIRLVGFDTSNGHFGWHVEYYHHGKMGKIYLADVPSDIDSYTDYMEGMFEQEYPDQYAALQEFFKENRPEPPADTEIEFALPKKVFRKIISDFSLFKRNLADRIFVGLTESRPEVPRRELRVAKDAISSRIEFRYAEIFNEFKEKYRTYVHNRQVRANAMSRGGFTIVNEYTVIDEINVLLRVIANIYREELIKQSRNWEHFINFSTHFRDDYLEAIQDNLPKSINLNSENSNGFIMTRLMLLNQSEIFNMVSKRWNQGSDGEILVRNFN